MIKTFKERENPKDAGIETGKRRRNTKTIALNTGVKTSLVRTKKDILSYLNIILNRIRSIGMVFKKDSKGITLEGN